jgi:hypothetical protein
MDKYSIGDCFEFKENIQDFGVILLEENLYPDGKQFNLFPVKLDRSKTGIDKFRFGKAYLTSFIDFTTSKGKAEGFMVYYFMSQSDYSGLHKFFRRIGAVSLKDEYKNTTGGTVAENYDDFRYQLDLWKEMFGQSGDLIAMSHVLELKSDA